MLRRFASVMAVGGLALTSYSVMGAPAGATPASEGKNTIEVTKKVEGKNKGVGYEVVVDCKKTEENNNNNNNLSALDQESNPFPKTLTFGPEGGTQEVEHIRDGRTCTIVETHDGGASRVVVDPSECVFQPKDMKESIAPIDGQGGTTCHVTVTNIFDPSPTPPEPAAAGASTTPAAAAVAVVGTARFTG